ncbi:MAG TPA: polysaccharide deacetylase family protein [Woeseiaceae bacterium]|nr:polysaccharide deacetylase family protein [Woeseiaceae bacterium]
MKEESTNRRIASLSLDLDNQWSYMKTHGDPGWKTFPSYLDWSVPRILEFLKKRDQKITFFIVGQDAAQDCNADAMRAISEDKHEIGNHSFHHEPWLHTYSEEEMEKELELAEQAIVGATGQMPRGFRGPGFSLSDITLRTLSRRGYKYDATVFPNLLNPLARAYFFATSSLTAEEKEQRKELFGTWRDALRPVKPFQWVIDDQDLMELPVTTMPLFKTPIHLSYILFASRYSRTLAMMYFRLGLLMCRITGTAPSLLLHPLDFIGCDDVGELAFFPGMDMLAADKMSIVSQVLDILEEHFEPVTVGEHIDALDPPFRRLELEASRG